MHKEFVFTVTPAPGAFPKYVLIALMAATQLTAPVTGAHAAEFDEAVRAPEAPSNAELKKRIRDYFDTYARVNAGSAAGIIRDKAAHAKWFDTKWRLQRAIDTKRDLGDLSEFGLKPKGDGTYSVDIANFPQWTPLSTSVVRLLNRELFAAYTPELKERGFRDQDVDVIRAYTERTSPERLADSEKLSLSESFATKMQRRLARKEKLETPQLLAYYYQSARIQFEADRAWTVGLLEPLDKQRQRILESYFAEQDRNGSMAIAPDDVETSRLWMTEMISSGEYLRLLEAEKMEAGKTEVRQ